ncbi:hypothetical protein QJS10_CPB17g00396 [Acorus calamus]|uniref:PHD and RING finger domain-containing protein 1 n=1 Tax=Acorus calamus TaxID=4465 RepID=A0AAV9CRT9_ACOCL|nr:hypothetical protein QJS10_CPB17g00396 [Acorus calamus]
MADPDISPRKRPKTLTSKGKEKLVEPSLTDEPTVETCGICLSDGCGGGKGRGPVRGWIDSCGHYFCFVCIMEWSKVESRCPMCKRRFSTIRRPKVEGIHAEERIVAVPERDQVFHHLGNVTTGPFDLYAHVHCSECQGSSDENFLLLCDLCDSAAHTYCIGLGHTVPEGDWYCNDCKISREEHTNAQTDSDHGDIYSERLSDKVEVRDSDSEECSDKVEVTESLVSISEIVQDETGPHSLGKISDAHAHTTGKKVCKKKGKKTTEKREPQNMLPQPEQQTLLTVPAWGTENPIADPKTMKQGVRTLHRCRDLQRRIWALRENWEALRSGSLAFSSCLSDSSQRNDGRRESLEDIPHTSNRLESLNPLHCEKMGADVPSSKRSSDVERAWKMMQIAKKASGHRRINGHHDKKSTLMEANEKNPLPFDKQNTPAAHKLFHPVRSEKTCKHQPLETVPRCSKIQKFDVERDRPLILGKDSSVSRPSGNTQFLYSVKTPLVKISHGKEQPSSPCLDSLAKSLSKSPNVSCRKMELGESYSCKMETSKSNMVGNIVGKTRAMRDDDAKSEIQMMVKLNLKMMCRGQNLGVDRFKKVARSATHTILAACGLEHSESNVCSDLPKPLCSHGDRTLRAQDSNLMPDSCRECFYAYVKNVVSSVLMENTNIIQSSSQ